MLKKTLAVCVGIAVSLPSLATQFNASHARSMAMGGAGVASGRGVEAAFFNPALLSTQREGDRFEFITPYFAVDVADDDDLLDEFDDFDDKVDTFDDAIDAFDRVIETSDSANAVGASQNLSAALSDINRELHSFNDKALRVDPGIGAAFAMPGKKLGVALYAYNESKFAGRFLYSPSDSSTIESYADVLSTLADDIADDGNFDPNDYASIYDPDTNSLLIPDLRSSIAMVGISLSEIGVALSHEFEIDGHALAVGVTPKFIKMDSAVLNIIAIEEDDDGDLTSGLDDFDDKFDDAKGKDRNFNVDVGVAYKLDQFTFGGTIRNVIPQDYDIGNEVIRDITYSMNPHARAGAAWNNDWITLAADVDITEQESMDPDLNLDTRILSLGAEFAFWDTLFLRMGYRDNLGSAELDTLSVGLGLDFGMLIDVAVIVSEDADEAGFSAQIGGRF